MCAWMNKHTCQGGPRPDQTFVLAGQDGGGVLSAMGLNGGHFLWGLTVHFFLRGDAILNILAEKGGVGLGLLVWTGPVQD